MNVVSSNAVVSFANDIIKIKASRGVRVVGQIAEVALNWKAAVSAFQFVRGVARGLRLRAFTKLTLHSSIIARSF